METVAEAEVKMLILQLLDRLVDKRLVDFGGEMATCLLKTINLLMLRLLAYAPREATFCALLACLTEKARRPSDRQVRGQGPSNRTTPVGAAPGTSRPGHASPVPHARHRPGRGSPHDCTIHAPLPPLPPPPSLRAFSPARRAPPQVPRQAGKDAARRGAHHRPRATHDATQ